ncbi:MAG: protein PilJ [Porticoccaceae bacterium]|nr:MAG: protein PilJ [Porticoccaceae bacterium]
MIKATNKLNFNQPTLWLGLAFAVFMGLAAVTLVIEAIDSARDRQNLALVAELRSQSYRLSGLARDATNGDEQAFEALSSVVAQMKRDWARLKENAAELPPEVLAEFDGNLAKALAEAETILENKETILFLHQVVATLNERLPQLQEEHSRVVEILLDANAPADQVAVAQAQSWRAERIGRNIEKMLAGAEEAEAAADQFNRDANLFGRVLEGMKNGDPALGISRVTDPEALKSLQRITTQFEFVSNSIQEIFNAAPALFRARRAQDAILDLSPNLLAAGAALTDAINALPGERLFTSRLAALFAVVALVALAGVGVLTYQATRRNLKETAEANEKNQQAILRLLDEIEGLGDGDLTVEATVTEDFTGAIADAINFAILQLRELVARIQDTAERVSAAAAETRGTALELAEASEHQAQEIAGVSAAINEMAVSIDQVSANAAESAAVAERSVRIATNGAEVVQRNIQGMDTIREQIQDTSKRIKRLGESSQEIGDIVSLISDIADQTNILALNAAIQAAMAGDAGRGFAVVADEVQRLAERSANAAKQVAGLVKAIQTDTNEAVASMEQTTAEVVRGAELAHDAGRALEEIQSVSRTLAELIQDISTAASHQATTAAQISATMNVIQDITAQTNRGVKAAAESIGQLAENAIELRAFVAGFKLPEGLVAEALAPSRESAVAPPAASLSAPAAAPAEAVEASPEEAMEVTFDEEEVEEAAPAAAAAGPQSALEREIAGVDLDEFSIEEEERAGQRAGRS